jgi:hypothetical protein
LYLLTLTVKNRESLSSAFNHLSKSFRTLKDSKGALNPFKKVLGFVGQYEITRKDGTWHPHLHLIVEMPFEERIFLKGSSPFIFKTPGGSSFECRSSFQYDLISYWYSLTKDSFVVDFRPMQRASDGSLDLPKSISEVLKYVAKPCDEKGELDPSNLYEIASTLKGRRLLTSGGTLKDLKDTDNLFDDDLKDLDYNYLITHYLGNGIYSSPTTF